MSDEKKPVEDPEIGMKVDEKTEMPQITNPETAEASLENRLKENEKLVAALEKEHAATEDVTQEGTEDTEKAEEKSEDDEEAKSEEKSEDKEETEEVDWKAEAERLKAEQRRKDGIRGSELETLRRTNEELEARIASQKEAEAQEEARIAAIIPDDVDRDPTEEELIEEYGDDYADEIGRPFAVKNWKASNRRNWKAQKQLEASVDSRVQAKLEQAKIEANVDSFVGRLKEAVPEAIELDDNAETNGFGKYLNGDHQNTGVTRREVCQRIILAAEKGEGTQASLDRLAKIYADFTGKEPKKPASGKEAVREKEEKEEKAPQGKTPSGSKPDPKKLIMPTGRQADKKPTTGSAITVSSFENELRNSRDGGAFDETLKRMLEKARNGEVIGG